MAPDASAQQQGSQANSVVTAIAGQDRYVADPTFSSAELGPGVSVASECVFCALCSNTHRRTLAQSHTMAITRSSRFFSLSRFVSEKGFFQPQSARVEESQHSEATKISQRKKKFKRCRCFFRLPTPSGRTGQAAGLGDN